jgi:hypothetical protein
MVGGALMARPVSGCDPVIGAADCAGVCVQKVGAFCGESMESAVVSCRPHLRETPLMGQLETARTVD